mmetsp:Transcript_4148/g.14486  ORF Transcript_4148/g.14486 Transcript_4148/m.14486 type:complete len:209 (+) Transcript_4148:1427-2053(+)
MVPAERPQGHRDRPGGPQVRLGRRNGDGEVGLRRSERGIRHGECGHGSEERKRPCQGGRQGVRRPDRQHGVVDGRRPADVRGLRVQGDDEVGPGLGASQAGRTGHVLADGPCAGEAHLDCNNKGHFEREEGELHGRGRSGGGGGGRRVGRGGGTGRRGRRSRGGPALQRNRRGERVRRERGRRGEGALLEAVQDSLANQEPRQLVPQV